MNWAWTCLNCLVETFGLFSGREWETKAQHGDRKYIIFKALFCLFKADLTGHDYVNRRRRKIQIKRQTLVSYSHMIRAGLRIVTGTTNEGPRRQCKNIQFWMHDVCPKWLMVSRGQTARRGRPCWRGRRRLAVFKTGSSPGSRAALALADPRKRAQRRPRRWGWSWWCPRMPQRWSWRWWRPTCRCRWGCQTLCLCKVKVYGKHFQKCEQGCNHFCDIMYLTTKSTCLLSKDQTHLPTPSADLHNLVIHPPNLQTLPYTYVNHHRYATLI